MWSSWLIVLIAQEQGTIKETAKAIENYLKINHMLDKQEGYTISGFLGKTMGEYKVDIGEKVIIRLTCLKRETFGQINMHLFRNKMLKMPILLDTIPFQVVDIKIQPESSPYIHCLDYMSAREEIRQDYILKLLSPTTFQIGERYEGKVHSKLLFKNLASKYRKYMGETVPKEVLEVLEEIEVESLQEYEKVYKMMRQNIPTIKGTYKLTYKGEDTTIKMWLQTLLNFGTYIGIGYYSHLGWGANQLIE